MTNAVLPTLNKRYTKEQILDAIYRNYGARTFICKELDCSPKQLSKWLDNHQDVKFELIKAREAVVDMAQKAIIDSLNSENEQVKLRAAEITLKALGNEYGWYLSDKPAMQVCIDNERKTVDIKTIFGISE